MYRLQEKTVKAGRASTTRREGVAKGRRRRSPRLCVDGRSGIVGSSAERPSQPDPSELWRSYPLEQKPATVAKSPAVSTASKQRNTQAPASSAGDKAVAARRPR
jgi:hypothetical protein